MKHFEKKIIIKFAALTQAFFILLIAYKTSFSLRPFIDEIVSLSSSNNFFKSLIFQGPPSTPYGSAYSPNLTTGPIASVGSNIGLFFFDSIYKLRFLNFCYLYILQIAFSLILSKKYKLSFFHLTMFSSFVIVSVPWWYSSLYSLGDLICTYIFINSVFLYNFYPKSSVFVMSLTIFYGRILLLIPFLGFYLFTLVKKRKLDLKEILAFSIPPFLWIWLILNFSTYTNLFEYFKDYYQIVYSTNPSINKVGGLGFIYALKNSDIVFWNPADFLRVLISPLMLSYLIFNSKKFKTNFMEKIKFPAFYSYIGFYLSFWLFSPTKSIIYSQIFTTIVLLLALLSFMEEGMINKFEQTAVFLIISFYFSSLHLIIFGFALFLINTFLKTFINSRSLLVLLLILNYLNLFYETGQKDSFENINFESCIKNLQSVECFENYLDNSYIFDK